MKKIKYIAVGVIVLLAAAGIVGYLSVSHPILGDGDWERGCSILVYYVEEPDTFVPPPYYGMRFVCLVNERYQSEEETPAYALKMVLTEEQEEAFREILSRYHLRKTGFTGKEAANAYRYHAEIRVHSGDRFRQVTIRTVAEEGGSLASQVEMEGKMYRILHDTAFQQEWEAWVRACRS